MKHKKFRFLLSHLLEEKVLFWGQIFKVEILTNLHVLRSSESEKHIFSKWSVCMCVCLLSDNSKTKYSRNIKFGILHLYYIQMLLETFYKDRTKTLCTGAHKRILIYFGLWREFLSNEFSYF